MARFGATTIADMSVTTTDHGESKSTRWIIAWIARAITYLLYAYVLIVEIILVIGFLLKLFGASRASGFVDWWYRHLEDVMEPFSGIFGSIELGTTSNDVQSVFETSILFAMVIYGIVAIALHGLISWLGSMLHRIEQRRLEEDRRHAYEQALARAQQPYDPTQRMPATPSQPYPTAGPAQGAVVPGQPGTSPQPPAPSPSGAPSPPQGAGAAESEPPWPPAPDRGPTPPPPPPSDS
jgi:hypothetical protein